MSRILTDQGQRELDLIVFRSDAFRRRLFDTMARIEVTLRKATNPYVAFSGGKDSLVVGCLVERVAGQPVTMAWSDDELEYPETVALMTALVSDPNLVITTGASTHAGWFRPWTNAPYWREQLPGTHTIAIPQDDWMARRGYDLTFVGTRAEENRKRRDWLRLAHVQYGASYPVKGGTGHRCCPIWDWSSDDVWALIAGWGIPVNGAYAVYDRIEVARQYQRVGPLPLARRSHLEAGWPDLLQRLEKRYGTRWDD